MRYFLLLISLYALNASAQSESLVDSLQTINDSKEIIDEDFPAWEKYISLGINVGHSLELNSPSGTTNKAFSSTNSLDFGLNYSKEGAPFQMTNELHYMMGLQKDGTQSGSPVQRILDDLTTLHDFSISSKKNQKWNLNIILQIATSALSIYDGDYLKDVNQLGRVQGFFNPYDITLSPGIKYEASDYLRISLSPYSIQLYGLRDQQIADTGYYTDPDLNGNYPLKANTPLGADINVWYDRKVKKWLQMQYRIGVSSNYFNNIAQNGILDGLFITKVKLISDVYLMHRATLNGDFTNNPMKPNYKQTILLSFSKSL